MTTKDVKEMSLEDQEKYLEKKYNESQRLTDSLAEQLKIIRLMLHSAKSDIFGEKSDGVSETDFFPRGVK